jgi:hypothetical protein
MRNVDMHKSRIGAVYGELVRRFRPALSIGMHTGVWNCRPFIGFGPAPRLLEEYITTLRHRQEIEAYEESENAA